jgi:hypothetical protein
MEQLKQAWEADHKMVLEKQRMVDSSIVEAKKTVQNNTTELVTVSRTLESLMSKISEEFEKIAGKIKEKEVPKPEVSTPMHKIEEVSFFPFLSLSSLLFSSTFKYYNNHYFLMTQLLEKLDASLAENAKLQLKKKYQLTQLTKLAEELETILTIPLVERERGMSKVFLLFFSFSFLFLTFLSLFILLSSSHLKGDFKTSFKRSLLSRTRIVMLR